MRMKDRALKKTYQKADITPVDVTTISDMMLNLYKFALLAESKRRKMKKGR